MKRRNRGKREKGWKKERKGKKTWTVFQTSWDYTLFLVDYEIFTKNDHILGHKEALNKYTKSQVLQITFSGDGASVTTTTTKKSKGK